MLFLSLFIISIHSVASSRLANIDPYGGDPETNYYLELGCLYYAAGRAERFESGPVRDKLFNINYKKCLDTIWPDNSFVFISDNDKCLIEPYHSFQVGDALLTNDENPSFIAPYDGFLISDYSRGSLLSFFIFYHQDKPPMDIAILKQMSWPEDSKLLTFRNNMIKSICAPPQSQSSMNISNLNVALDVKLQKSIPFFDFKRWIQSCFNLKKFTPNRLHSFRAALSSTCPSIGLFRIEERKTSLVIPLHAPFIPVPPFTPLALTYDPNSLTPTTASISSFTTIFVTSFEHKGTIYHILLFFSIV